MTRTSCTCTAIQRHRSEFTAGRDRRIAAGRLDGCALANSDWIGCCCSLAPRSGSGASVSCALCCCACCFAASRAFYDKRISHEVTGDHLGDDFKGYVFKISGGNDKQGFAMKQVRHTEQQARRDGIAVGIALTSSAFASLSLSPGSPHFSARAHPLPRWHVRLPHPQAR